MAVTSPGEEKEEDKKREEIFIHRRNIVGSTSVRPISLTEGTKVRFSEGVWKLFFSSREKSRDRAVFGVVVLHAFFSSAGVIVQQLINIFFGGAVGESCVGGKSYGSKQSPVVGDVVTRSASGRFRGPSSCRINMFFWEERCPSVEDSWRKIFEVLRAICVTWFYCVTTESLLWRAELLVPFLFIIFIVPGGDHSYRQ